MKTLHDKLVDIQGRLKAPKNQRNNFGNYNYRSCEDILEAVKPLLTQHKLALNISDEIKQVGDIIYVEATVVISDGEQAVESKASAGIDPSKKGMDISQTFGSSSSYARKYALNGLFLIDDTKDSDATNTHGKGSVVQEDDDKEWLPKTGAKFDNAKSAIASGKVSMTEVRKKYKVSKEVEKLLLN